MTGPRLRGLLCEVKKVCCNQSGTGKHHQGGCDKAGDTAAQALLAHLFVCQIERCFLWFHTCKRRDERADARKPFLWLERKRPIHRCGRGRACARTQGGKRGMRTARYALLRVLWEIACEHAIDKRGERIKVACLREG